MASSEHRREWYRAFHSANKERRNAARRAAHAKNPERLRAKDRARYAASPDAKKKSDIRSKYGPVAAMVSASTYACEACGDLVSGKTKHIDHDHSKPKKEAFRGILCASCNCALGYLRDDPVRIRSLLRYIEFKKEAAMESKRVHIISKLGAQGDVLFRRIGALPDGVVEQKRAGAVVVAHSETGHHHEVESMHVRHFERATRDPMICFLQVADGQFADVVHKRPFDTHETIRLTPGFWEVRRQEEFTPEGWRQVLD